MTQNVRVEGLAEVMDALKNVLPREARNIMRGTIQSIAAKIAKEAKRDAPKGRTMALSKGMKAKRLKSHPDRPVSEVYNKDAWYWRFVEYGTGGGKGSHGGKKGLGEVTYQGNAKPFIQPAKDRAYANMPKLINDEVFKRLKKLADKKAKSK